MITLKGSSGIYEGPTIEEMYTDGIEVNTKFHELNTDKYYYYDGSDWVEIPGGGGGGGGFVPTEDQLAAMNSGATTEKINQIETNKNNIISIVNSDGRYNVLNFAALSQSYSAAITTNKQDDYIIVTANGKFCTVSYAITLKAGDYVYQTRISDYSAEGQTVVMISATSNGSTPIKTINITGNGIVHTDFTLENDTTIYLLYSPNPTSTTNTTNTYTSSENEIVPKSLYDSGMTNYQPYVMTNAEITAWILAQS